MSPFCYLSIKCQQIPFISLHPLLFPSHPFLPFTISNRSVDRNANVYNKRLAKGKLQQKKHFLFVCLSPYIFLKPNTNKKNQTDRLKNQYTLCITCKDLYSLVPSPSSHLHPFIGFEGVSVLYSTSSSESAGIRPYPPPSSSSFKLLEIQPYPPLSSYKTWDHAICWSRHWGVSLTYWGHDPIGLQVVFFKLFIRGQELDVEDPAGYRDGMETGRMLSI